MLGLVVFFFSTLVVAAARDERSMKKAFERGVYFQHARSPSQTRKRMQKVTTHLLMVVSVVNHQLLISA